MNSKYKIVVRAPLLRPGLTVTTEVSEKYVVPTTKALMNMVRDINTKEKSPVEQLKAAMRHSDDAKRKPPTTVRIMPKRHKYDPFHLGAVAEGMEERKPIHPCGIRKFDGKDIEGDMPMTRRYYAELAKRDVPGKSPMKNPSYWDKDRNR